MPNLLFCPSHLGEFQSWFLSHQLLGFLLFQAPVSNRRAPARQARSICCMIGG
jgi:hypothetical protein